MCVCLQICILIREGLSYIKINVYKYVYWYKKLSLLLLYTYIYVRKQTIYPPENMKVEDYADDLKLQANIPA